MTTEQLNPTPKARFQDIEANVKGHHALLENPAFNRAEDMAMLNYNRTLAKDLLESQNPQLTAMQNALKLAGVQEFINEFRMLAEKKQVIESPGLARSLNHKA